MSQRIEIRARVRITIDVPVEDRWGTDCKLDQVFKQATESAIGRIRQGIKFIQTGADAQIVGEPIVTAILVDESVK